jgi:outer membrane biosynthesis protein TonB
MGIRRLLPEDEEVEALLMARWVAGLAVATALLFAASFALARSGRPAAEPAAAGDTAPKALPAVSVPAGVGDLRRLHPASLPALEKAPQPQPAAASPAPATPSPPPADTTAPPATDTSPAPAPAPGPAPNPAPAPEPGGGCDPCG